MLQDQVNRSQVQKEIYSAVFSIIWISEGAWSGLSLEVVELFQAGQDQAGQLGHLRTLEHVSGGGWLRVFEDLGEQALDEAEGYA